MKSLPARARRTGARDAVARRIAWFGAVLLLFSGLPADPAAAQATPGIPGLSEPTAPAEPAEASDPRDELRAQLEALLQRLEDPAATRELAGNVRLLLDALEAGGAIETEAAAAEGDEIGEALSRAKPAAAELLARIEEDLRRRLDAVRLAGQRVYRTSQTVPGLLTWARQALDEPDEWQGFAQGALGIVALLGLGLLAMWLAARALRRAHHALVFREDDRLLSRWIMALFMILLRIVPIVVFALVVNALILLFQPDEIVKVWLSAGVSAIVIVRLGLVLANALLSPGNSLARLVPLSDEAAHVLQRYAHWLLALGVYGLTLVSVLQWHGMPPTLRGALDRMIALALLASACWMVIRRRREVGASIARLAVDMPGFDRSSIPWRRIGSVWHVLAILYLCALWGVYTIGGAPLFIDVLTTSTLSLALLIGLVITLRYVEGKATAVERPPPAETTEADQEEEEEALPRPHPSALLIALRIAILVVAVLTFLQVWGLDTWNWFLRTDGGPGERITLIVLIVAVIYLLWLGINGLIARYIRRLEAEAGAARSVTRKRTALVVARNASFVALCVIGAMVILSELGLNIGPLLAGAGVIGIAIGFGAQHLVQDVITGLFNLIEDTFAVGDVVDLGGKSGVVEAVTIRTVRLRDLTGNVHTIPFSAIAVVTNMTKEFAFASFEIGVAYRESVDHVMQVIRGVAEDFRRDRAYRRVILEPMEMLGVDAFADSAVILKCRLKVRAGSQWMIGREFRRRLKNRFDELGIEIPFPHRTIYFGEDRSGAAPPAHVVVTSATEGQRDQAPESAARPAVPRLAD
jgi:small conductance mechanosensitive channel